MNRHKRFLVISLALNFIFLLFFSFLCIYKRQGIMTSFARVLQKFDGHSPTESVLAAFNVEPLDCSNGFYSIGANEQKCISMLFLGNSITYHKQVEDTNHTVIDTRSRGLASTRLENDYVHILVEMLAAQKHSNIKYSIVNIAGFERNFAKPDFDTMAIMKTWLKNCHVLYDEDGMGGGKS